MTRLVALLLFLDALVGTPADVLGQQERPGPAQSPPAQVEPTPGTLPGPENRPENRLENRLENRSDAKSGLAGSYVELGRALMAQGDLVGAVTELREALRLEPTLIPARSSLASALYNLGDLESAIEEYRALLRLQPDDAQAHANLATVLMAKHEWTAARTELKEAVRLKPELVQAHYSLGAVRYTLGDLPGAIEAYRQAVRLKPEYADAHYNLGLLLKLINEETEAAQELLAAARAGFPKAQYLLGADYAAGLGVERNLALAIMWWSRAAEQGLAQAREALGQLRQAAVLTGKQSDDETRAVVEAFQSFRREIWQEFPDLQGNTADESVGVGLVRQGRIQEAVPVLIREAYALSDPAQDLLETLYRQGAESQLMPYDARILAYFKTTAAEGLPRPRLILARIYARGLGIPQDLAKAISLLKGHPQEDAQRLLQALLAMSQDAAPTAPATPATPATNDAPSRSPVTP